MQSKAFEMALHYAELGYKVFPCAPNSKAPLSSLVPNGFKNASDDPAIIEEWFRQAPHANLAIPTEGIVVIDIDTIDGEWPAEGNDFPSCPVALTPRGFKHYVFKQTEGKTYKCSNSVVAEDVDVKTDGGYILVFPSVTKNGAYKWAETLELCKPSRLPAIPEWLDDELEKAKTRVRDTPAIAGNAIPKHHRNSTLISLAGSMRRVGMTEPEILAAMLQANAARCKPPLSENEVAKVSASAASYEPDQRAVAMAEGHYSQLMESEDDKEPEPPPEEILRAPGFISELMDHTLNSAPYPNVTLAFAGALSLLSTLTGRKIRDASNNRTNMYILALANAGAGKDFPRKVNVEVMELIGLQNNLGTAFASGEGIQDALLLNPCMLFQTDEFDAMLQSINKGRDPRYEGIMATLLTLYSSSNSILPMRHKANQEYPGRVVQPHLVLLGTAIPIHYYSALSTRMLTNGFFARMIVFESTKRGKGQISRDAEPPPRVLEQAKYWADYNPGKGNLSGDFHPKPALLDYSGGGLRLATEVREYCDKQYENHEGMTLEGAVGAAVWGRAFENISKFALIYAASEGQGSGTVTETGIAWGAEIVTKQIARTLWMANKHSDTGDFESLANKLVQIIKSAEDKDGMERHILLKKSRMKARDMDDVLDTLMQRGDVAQNIKESEGRGATGIIYKAR